MSLVAVRNRIDDWLAPRWSWLVGKQDDYFTANGRYFQGLWTHSFELEQTDALNGDTIPDRLTDSPTDQAHTWRDALGNAFDNLPLPARLRIDVYDDPSGHGWVATLEVLYLDNVYIRAKQIGPDTSLTHDWQLAGPEGTLPA